MKIKPQEQPVSDTAGGVRAARDTLRSLLEGISEATMLLNRELNVLYANTAARMLFTTPLIALLRCGVRLRV
jgi:PAS domain-containing protein